MDTIRSDLRDGRQRRRRHSDEFKSQVVAECSRPGVSIAAVALHHGLNANLLRRWVTQAGSGADEPLRAAHAALEAFVPVAIENRAEVAVCNIEVEIKRGPMSVKIQWPMSAAAEFGAWLRELLR